MKEWFIRGCVIVSSVLLYVLFWYNTLKPIELTVGVYAGSYWGTSVGNMYQVLDKATCIRSLTKRSAYMRRSIPG